MNSTRSHRRSLVVLNLVAALALSGAGVAATTDTIVSPNGVELRPYRGYESAALRVTGPDGLVIEQVFEGSTSIWLPLLDDQGAALPDGDYTWSLTLTPALSPKVKEQLRQARENGDENIVLELRASGALPDPADMISSGSLKVTGGAFVVPSTDIEERVRTTGESAAKGSVDDQDVPTRDQVIPDDLIVQGSICVGFDCVTGESFGFDTLRLKENNLRIKFEDTSAGTFPTTDWQLTANDSASGGQNKFSIEDITSARVPFTIEGASTTNSIYVDSTGRVGFRTSTPVLDLHIATSNTPGLRLEQNSSGGFTAQTWDIAGNEANFFVRDVTSGSRLPFRIRPGAPTSSIDIAADGDVGIGTASPDASLHIVRSTGSAANLIKLTNNHSARLQFENTGTGKIWQVRVGNVNSAFGISDEDDVIDEFNLDVSGNLTIAGTLTEGSDVHRKSDFEPVDSAAVLQKVVDLPITTWVYNGDDTLARHLGPTAQDFHSAFGLGATDTGISARNLGSVALVALQEMYRQIQERDSRIEALELELRRLKEALTVDPR